MSALPFPHFTLSSDDPFERGRQLGAAASRYVHGSVDAYADIFAHYTGLGWDDVRERAVAFRDPIGEYDAEILRELEGIAAGADLQVEDLLAVNARSEIMFGLGTLSPSECTSFYVGPSASADGHILIGQNWDWLEHCAGNTILVEIEQSGRPSFVMCAEAGLVGKIGFNAAGLGVALNALVSSLDDGEPGVPVHVILRAILNATTIEEAVAAVVRARRSSSANYLIGSARGAGVDVETAPGGVETVFLVHPEGDLLSHANHFACPVSFRDVAEELGPDSRLREEAMSESLAARRGTLTRDSASRLLGEHGTFAESVCRHVDETKSAAERAYTVAALVIDLSDGIASIAAGPPCTAAFVTLEPSFGQVAA